MTRPEIVAGLRTKAAWCEGQARRCEGNGDTLHASALFRGEGALFTAAADALDEKAAVKTALLSCEYCPKDGGRCVVCGNE